MLTIFQFFFFNEKKAIKRQTMNLKKKTNFTKEKKKSSTKYNK